MLAWFRDRIRNSRPWFSIKYPISGFEGTKLPTGELHLTMTQSDKQMDLKLDREAADKLSMWLSRMYPARSQQNVIQLRKAFPLRIATPDPSGNTPSPGKELE